MKSSYDGGLITSQSGSGAFNWSMNMSYNDDFLLRYIDIQGSFFGLSYNDDNQISSAGSASYTYFSDNPLLSTVQLGPMASTYDYNGFGELASLDVTFDASLIYSASFERDGAGRITSKSEDGVTSVFSYDDQGQLLEVNSGGEVTSYSYDLNGNRLSVTQNLQTIYASFDEQDRILTQGSLSFEYDDNGYTTKILNSEDNSEIILDYDLLGNLKSFDHSDIEIDYAVDPLGRRIAKYKNESFIEGYIYKDQLNPIARVSSSGVVEQLFIYGIKSHVPEYMSYNGINYKFITDERGSVRMVVNSSTGEVVQEISYDAFGQVLSDTNPGFQPFGFAGGLYDPDTNLVRFGARDYNPTTGRWLAKDPIGFNGADTNLYRYSLNDPVNKIDPDGRFAIIVGIGTISLIDYALGTTLVIGSAYFLDQLINIYSKNKKKNKEARDFAKKFSGSKDDERKIRKYIEELSGSGDYNLDLDFNTGDIRNPYNGDLLGNAEDVCREK